MDAYDEMAAILEMAAEAAGSELYELGGSELYELGKLAEARNLLDYQISETVARARSAGWSWTAIAEELEVTKQAAQQRYGRQAFPLITE